MGEHASATKNTSQFRTLRGGTIFSEHSLMRLAVGGLITVQGKGSLASLLLYALHCSEILCMEFGLTEWQIFFMRAVPLDLEWTFQKYNWRQVLFCCSQKALQKMKEVAEVAILNTTFGYLLRSCKPYQKGRFISCKHNEDVFDKPFQPGIDQRDHANPFWTIFIAAINLFKLYTFAIFFCY